jgi:GNAT superfamily N-acetyltransferase
MYRKRAAAPTIRTVDEREIIARHHELEELLTDAIRTSGFGIRVPVEQEVTNTLALARGMSGWLTIVAEVDGRLCGALITEVEPDRSSAFVRWLAVSPSHRRQGVGTQLMDHFEETAQPELVRGMVDVDDPAAAAFWGQRGWTSLLTPRRRIPMGRTLDA